MADLQNRLGATSASNPITPAAATAALNVAGAMLGISAAAVPVFDPVTNQTSDANTIQLAALAVAVNSLAGMTMADKVKTLANSLVIGGNTPNTIISQSNYNNGLLTVTKGGLSILTPGARLPQGAFISLVTFSQWHQAYRIFYPLVWSSPTTGGILSSDSSWDICPWQ